MQVSIKHFETQNHPAMFPEGKIIEFFPIHDDFNKVFNKTIEQNGGSASLQPAVYLFSDGSQRASPPLSQKDAEKVINHESTRSWGILDREATRRFFVLLSLCLF